MSSKQKGERVIISEFIKLVQDLPCLWDTSSPDYKNKTRRNNAWEMLTQKLKEIDPNANEVSAKKKLDHLKYSYLREVKKVKESIRCALSSMDIHKPNLWYFDMMTFLDKQNDGRISGADSLSGEEELNSLTDLFTGGKLKRKNQHETLETKKQKLIDTAQNLLDGCKTGIHPFLIYVGEKLDKLAPDQREIAEKLILDVIFLASTNNLKLDSRIETPSRLYSFAQNANPSPSSLDSPSSADSQSVPETSVKEEYDPESY